VYGGWVDSTGPRYCPSIEDKIVRFRDKDSHQVLDTVMLSGCMLVVSQLQGSVPQTFGGNAPKVMGPPH
jgi:tRNA uridine 5-carboxymethylaminomethyl modification enzyme